MTILLLGAFVLFLDWKMSSSVSEVKHHTLDMKEKIAENNRMLEELADEAEVRRKFLRDTGPMGGY